MAERRNDDLIAYLDGLSLAPGVRSLTAVRSAPSATVTRGRYRGRNAAGELLQRPAPQQIVSLVRDGDLLRWQLGTPLGRVGAGRASRAALPDGYVVKQLAFETLDGSKVASALLGLDRQLTPHAVYAAGGSDSGLRRWSKGSFQQYPQANAAQGKSVLLFIHGTFSNSEALLTEGLSKTVEGRKLLADAERRYDVVLAYDHPTLSVSPALNAFDLAAQLRPPPARLDIVCHSRGGLVARWLCEAFADPRMKTRVVFVASPLAGTSLASAARLRGTFDLLTNVADVLRTASDVAAATVAPLFVGVSGLLRVFTSVTGTLGSAPIFDAALALVPGLNGQSRDGTNEEIRRLRGNTGTANFTKRYFAISANFEPSDPKWNFLKYFSQPFQRLADLGADLVFKGKNDLVVDTLSMSEVADATNIVSAHDFGDTDAVHHLNYFRQPLTVAGIRSSFGIP